MPQPRRRSFSARPRAIGTARASPPPPLPYQPAADLGFNLVFFRSGGIVRVVGDEKARPSHRSPATPHATQPVMSNVAWLFFELRERRCVPAEAKTAQMPAGFSMSGRLHTFSLTVMRTLSSSPTGCCQIGR